MHTTTTSKFPIYNLTNSHDTQVPTCEVDIDFAGVGVDAFIGQISNRHAYRFKDRDEAGLSKLVKLYNVIGTPQGLSSAIPGWARQGRYADYEGLDVSKPFEMTVRTGEEGVRLYYDNETGDYGMTVVSSDNSCWNEDGDLFAGTPYLCATEQYHVHVRYTVEIDKTFDPALIAMECVDVLGSRFIKRFEYNGRTIKPEVSIWPYEAPTDRTVKILLN